MRARFDENGNIVSYHSVIFENIPDDYKMQSVLTGDHFCDLSYVGLMKQLRTEQASEEFLDNKFYSPEVLSHLALDYINSAICLHSMIINNRDDNIVSYYLIPCAFCCKHSIELKLKECLIEKGCEKLKSHSVLVIWNNLDEREIPHSAEITTFIEEVEIIDNSEMALRYGISKNLEPLQEKYKFNIDKLIENTMYLFNILDEHVICRYRYQK